MDLRVPDSPEWLRLIGSVGYIVFLAAVAWAFHS
jgi:hypothetical protein